MKMAQMERTPRELDTRTNMQRPTKWQPPQLLPEPNPEPGYAFRWIRISTNNAPDATNVSSKFREGWEPVKASQHPEIQLLGANNTRFPDGVEIGGLLLCKIPSEFMVQRDAHFRGQTEAAMDSVDRNFMRESDPRMNTLFKDRKSSVSFGKGT